MDVWLKNSDGTPFVGKVWPDNPTYFGDFSKPESKEWWKINFKEFHDLLAYDAIWIDMNEPANFATEGNSGRYYCKYDMN